MKQKKLILMEEKIKKLNRFTTLPILIDLLERKKLVLIEPTSWDDRNDTLIFETYKKKAKIDKLFALCFSYKDETIHHWKTFADGNSGCCIQFDGKELIGIFDATPQIRHGVVKYKKIKDIDSFTINKKDIPFTKRKPYELEKEYRIIWEGKTEDHVFELPVSLETIQRITFGQKMPESVFQSLKEMLESRYPILEGKINRSTIYENKEWVRKFE